VFFVRSQQWRNASDRAGIELPHYGDFTSEVVQGVPSTADLDSNHATVGCFPSVYTGHSPTSNSFAVPIGTNAHRRPFFWIRHKLKSRPQGMSKEHLISGVLLDTPTALPAFSQMSLLLNCLCASGCKRIQACWCEARFLLHTFTPKPMLTTFRYCFRSDVSILCLIT
jgi:hypothetical protein